MARAAKATTTRRSATVAVPKKKIGRPVGLKNRVTASLKGKAAAAPKRTVVRRASATPAPIRMNKAELEVQVIKLERSLARARAQTAELKQALKGAHQPAATATARPETATTKTTRKKATSTPVKRTRRTKAEMAAAEQAENAEADQSGE